MYPVCIAGARAAQPEDCAGPQAFLALRDHFSMFYIAERILAILEDADVDDPQAELEMLQKWLRVDRFDRSAVTGQLRQYAAAHATVPTEHAEVRA